MDEDQVVHVDTRNVKQTGVNTLGRTTVDLVPGTPRNIPSLYPASSLFSWRPADHLHLLRKHCLTYLTHTHTHSGSLSVTPVPAESSHLVGMTSAVLRSGPQQPGPHGEFWCHQSDSCSTR